MYRVRLVGFTHKYSLLSPARRNISIILPSLSRRTIQGGNRLVRGASSSLLQIFFYEPCPHKIGLSLLAYFPFNQQNMAILLWICGNCVYARCETGVSTLGAGSGLDTWRGAESKQKISIDSVDNRFWYSASLHRAVVILFQGSTKSAPSYLDLLQFVKIIFHSLPPVGLKHAIIGISF